jgi:hypothetical protein
MIQDMNRSTGKDNPGLWKKRFKPGDQILKDYTGLE